MSIPKTTLKSFISEHTAEYALVPDLIRRLSPYEDSLFPIFFSSTREASATACANMGHEMVRVIAAFPRRPKVTTKRRGRIFMKINRPLIAYASEAAKIGIPVIAGLPLIESLQGLNATFPCAWYNLQKIQGGEDRLLELGVNGGVIAEDPPVDALSHVLSDDEIASLVSKAARYPWDWMAGELSTLRRTTLTTNFPFGAGYRPFFLVFIDT